MANEFVRVIRDEGASEIGMYKTAFFRGSDLAFLDANDRDVAKRHLLDEFDRAPTLGLMQGLAGIAKFLTAQDAESLTDAAVKFAQQSTATAHRSAVGAFVDRLWIETKPPIDTTVHDTMKAWMDTFDQSSNTLYARWAGQLAGVGRIPPSDEMDVDDIPF